jgi:hypothetical protein
MSSCLRHTAFSTQVVLKIDQSEGNFLPQHFDTMVRAIPGFNCFYLFKSGLIAIVPDALGREWKTLFAKAARLPGLRRKQVRRKEGDAQ